MLKAAIAMWTAGALLTVGVLAFAQEQTKPADSRSEQVPVDTQWTLDAAGSVQRNAIRSVLPLECMKTARKGTGFIISGGKVITAAHVVAGCEAEDLKGTTPLKKAVQFSRPLIRDEHRDLAVLFPAVALDGGLELAPDVNIPLGKAVTTWGFPLIYNGPAPLLSVGYVSGYYGAQIEGRTVKHIVVMEHSIRGILAASCSWRGTTRWLELSFGRRSRSRTRSKSLSMVFTTQGEQWAGRFQNASPMEHIRA